MDTIDRHAPKKTRFLRGNHQPHLNKDLRKAIMKRSRLKNIANRTGSIIDYGKYKKQRNFVTNLNKNAKKLFFSKIGSDERNGCRDFWNHCKPLFSSKFSSPAEKILLIEDGEILNDENKVASTFNHYFVNITNTLPIQKWADIGHCDSIDQLLSVYEKHPSICKIKEQDFLGTFNFPHIHPREIFDAIRKLDPKKATSGSISTKTLQLMAEEICLPLTDCVNNCILDGIFPDELKLANVIPVHKGGDSCSKEMYRPISILPVLAKVIEKILAKHLSTFFQNRFSKLLCGFRSKHGTQHALFRLLQKWVSCLDNSGKVGTILMDLSKAFDSLPHELLLAKLSAYGVTKDGLKLLRNYLSYRYQRTKIGSSFSEWLETILGVPQGSVLGPLLFNIFINDLFLFLHETEVCNFADDNTLYCCSDSLEVVVSSLEKDLKESLKWFRANQLVANPDKFKAMFLGVGSSNKLSLSILGDTIECSENVKLLGIHIDNQLKFDVHINKICASAHKKINCLYRLRKYINIKQCITLSNAYILSSFNYCPLIWMFCNRTLGNLIDRVQRRCFRAIYNYSDDTPLHELFQKHEHVSIHTKHIRMLMTEIFKSIHSINPGFMKEVFIEKSLHYTLRQTSLLTLPRTKTTRFGANSVHFKGCLLWNNLPSDVKQAETIPCFKKRLEKISISCTCQLCKF